MADDERDLELDGALRRAVASLREDVPVRAAWRDALIERIERPEPAVRAWRVRPAFAIAAGLLLLVAGGVAGRMSRRDPAGPAAGAPAASVRFVYVAPTATRVAVVGDFNAWNPSAMPLKRLSDGTWIVDVPLTPGRYAYAFVVDGKVEVDPAAPRAESEFGTNSVVMVRGS